jgi:hypothetical protein
MPGGKGLYPCAVACCDPQNALVEEGVLSLSCKLAAVVIHRMLWWKKGAIPALPCKLAAVVIHMLWWKGVCYPCLMHASCCHDPQNALVEEGVLSLRCHASSLLL